MNQKLYLKTSSKKITSFMHAYNKVDFRPQSLISIMTLTPYEHYNRLLGT